MLHARRIISPSPVGPLSTAELLNPERRWVRLETLRLVDEFWHILEIGESLRPVFIAFADVLLLSLAATCNTAPHVAEHLPKIGLRIASDPDLRRAVTDAMPNGTIARAFADLCGTILVDAARHLELAELALSVPTLSMTVHVGALRYLAHDPDLHPHDLLRFHDTVMRRLTGADLAQALATSRQLTDDLTTTVDGPAPLRPFHSDEASDTTGASSIMRPASGSGEVDRATIRRLTASLRRLQARQKVLRQASDTSSRDAVETSDQIGSLFHKTTLLRWCSPKT